MSTIKSSSEHLTLNADGSNKDVKIQNNGSESVIVKSDGSVGVGTSSPSVKSEIQHSGTGGFPATSGTTQTYGILRLNSGGGWTSALDIGHNGGNGAWIQSTDTSNLATNYALYLNKNGGQVRVGSGGLTFNGDTAAANALDDYEEGTWTATLASGATTTPTATGHYTKIGREVHIYLNVNFGSIAVNGTALQISGLPFTPNHPTTGSMGYTARVQMQSTAHHFTAVDSGVTTVEYRYMSANVGGSSALLTQSSGTFTPAFQLAMTYLVP